MYKPSLFPALALVVSSTTGCGLLQAVGQASPPATTPVLDAVEAQSLARGPFLSIPASATGFQAPPNDLVRLKLSVPFPSGLTVEIDGAQFEQAIDDSDRDQRIQRGEGFYMTIEGPNQIDDTPTAHRTIDVYLPRGKRAAQVPIDLTLRVQSLNPNYSGTQRLSDPLAVHLYPVEAPSDVTGSTGLTYIEVRWQISRSGGRSMVPSRNFFTIYRRPGSQGGFFQIAETTVPDTVVVRDVPPTVNALYCYVVRARVDSGIMSLLSDIGCGWAKSLGD